LDAIGHSIAARPKLFADVALRRNKWNVDDDDLLHRYKNRHYLSSLQDSRSRRFPRGPRYVCVINTNAISMNWSIGEALKAMKSRGKPLVDLEQYKLIANRFHFNWKSLTLTRLFRHTLRERALESGGFGAGLGRLGARTLPARTSAQQKKKAFFTWMGLSEREIVHLDALSLISV
jgi:hypothetical protein